MLHNEDELKRRKNMSFGGCPVCLPHSLSVGPVKLAGPKIAVAGHARHNFWVPKISRNGIPGTVPVRYSTVLYRTPFISLPCFSPPKKEASTFYQQVLTICIPPMYLWLYHSWNLKDSLRILRYESIPPWLSFVHFVWQCSGSKLHHAAWNGGHFGKILEQLWAQMPVMAIIEFWIMKVKILIHLEG